MLADLLQGLIDNPDDTDRWLILADWIEEHDDPPRAALLRLHRNLLATCTGPDWHPDRAAWQSQMVSLLASGVQPVVPRQTIALAEGVDLTLAWIPPGRFLMGSPGDEPERNEYESWSLVNLTRGFWLGIHPLTQAQWQAVMGNNPSHFRGTDLPVEVVSWEDCQEYIDKLGGKAGPGFRLPTEAEWEYACRAGTTTPFFFGDTLTTDQANYNGNYPYGSGPKGVDRKATTGARSFPANAWGLYDMHGNVLNWCADWYRDEPHPLVGYTDPAGPSEGSERVIRGGSWIYTGRKCRAADRDRFAPSDRLVYVGFRLARSSVW